LKQGDVTVWKGSTDSTGAAEFTLSFTYFDGRTTEGGYSLHAQGAEPAAIGPFSETPIRFELPVSSSGGGDLNLAAVVSAALVAYVFLLLRWRWKSW
jgi:hypothetical protein